MAKEHRPLPYIKFSFDDFFNDPAVVRMTNKQVGAYLRLLKVAWSSDSPGVIPADDDFLAAASGMGAQWAAHRVPIARAFDTTSKDGFWVQKRIIREYHVAMKQAAHGLAGAKVRWAAHKGANATPMPHRHRHRHRENLEPTPCANPADSHPVAVASPQAKKTDTPDEWSDAFAEFFWPNYPRRVAKPAALRAWRAIKPQTEDTLTAIVDGLAPWVKHWKQRGDPNFIPHPATWLNQRRWEDTP